MSQEPLEGEYYTVEFIALVNSEPAINPRDCNYSIKTALERKLPGCEKAQENYHEIVRLIEKKTLDCLIEEIYEDVWVPPSTRNYVRSEGYYKKELIERRYHFTFEEAQAYVPRMGAFKNPFLNHEPEMIPDKHEVILDQGNKELECLRLMLACLMRDTLKGSKYSGESSISARAKYFQQMAIEHLENPRGFGNSTLRARIKAIDLLMSEKQKFKK